VTLSSDGFFLEAHPKLRPVDTFVNGIFIAGCCQGPKDIQDTVSQGSAAASRAAAILSKRELEIDPLIAVVDEDFCSGCGICLTVCPYTAIERVEKDINGKVVIHAKVNEGLCQGCGTCVSACPSSAIQQRGFKDKQLLPMIDEISC
jgi:heterodisulfide reductase subunit A